MPIPDPAELIGPHPEAPEPCPLDCSCEGDEPCGCWCDLHDCSLAACPSYKMVTAGLRAAYERGVRDGRAQAASDIRNMPHELGDVGWQHLADNAAEADWDPELVHRRRRRNDFTTDTIGAAYQYGYRRAAEVAAGSGTRAQPPDPHDSMAGGVSDATEWATDTDQTPADSPAARLRSFHAQPHAPTAKCLDTCHCQADTGQAPAGRPTAWDLLGIAPEWPHEERR